MAVTLQIVQAVLALVALGIIIVVVPFLFMVVFGFAYSPAPTPPLRRGGSRPPEPASATEDDGEGA